ncbi:MAG: TIGR01777 family oxidoreductase [Flavobacteriales bacterium]|nr:TIGR01777 family oxidoreductase [Flavobacteriales bacterium]
MATILITGASGLIGTALSRSLLASGHVVHHLGRGVSTSVATRSFTWDPSRDVMDASALNGVTHIVHLAGAGIADKRWSKARVQELITSRTATARLLLRCAREHGRRIDSFVSAAGIGYYGAVTTDHTFVENDGPASDTIGTISSAWESAVDEWRTLTRVVKLRTPVVLTNDGGALPKLAAPVKFGLGAPVGSGRQWMPWVHLADLVRIYGTALFNERMEGAYNVNTGNDVRNDDFMRTMAQTLHKPYFLPGVPAFALRLALGELSSVLLEGSRASNARLLETGFQFDHPQLKMALTGLYR